MKLVDKLTYAWENKYYTYWNATAQYNDMGKRRKSVTVVKGRTLKGIKQDLHDKQVEDKESNITNREKSKLK